MRAGPKDRTIALQEVTRTQDATGHPVESWATVRTVHAQKMEGPKVSERYAAFQLAASVLMVFRCGYWPAYELIGPSTHRVLYEGKPLDIVGRFEMGRKKGVEIVTRGRTE